MVEYPEEIEVTPQIEDFDWRLASSAVTNSLKYGMAIVPMSEYTGFRQAKLELSSQGGEVSIRVLTRGSLNRQREAILKRRLEEILTQHSQAPPGQVCCFRSPIDIEKEILLSELRGETSYSHNYIKNPRCISPQCRRMQSYFRILP